MIYFETIGGLCNRMRSISSAYYFAKDNNQKLIIIWANNDECNCRIDDVFLFPKDKTVRVIYLPFIGNSTFSNRIRNYIHKQYIHFLEKKCTSFHRDMRFDTGKDLLIINKEDVFISSFAKWYPKENEFDIFLPSINVADKVSKIIAEFTNNTIGVHIRRGDNIVSTKNSPVELFIDEMKKEVNKDPYVKFFVSTDSLEELEKLISEFGKEKIIYQKQMVNERNSKEGIVSAAVDLFCLSKTNKIIGSSCSSFSDTAAEIGNIDITICTNNEIIY